MKGRRKRVSRKDGSTYRSKGQRKRWGMNRKERSRRHVTAQDRTQQEVWSARKGKAGRKGAKRS